MNKKESPWNLRLKIVILKISHVFSWIVIFFLNGPETSLWWHTDDFLSSSFQ